MKKTEPISELRPFSPKSTPKPPIKFNLSEIKLPILIEIGSGTGDFALDYAKLHTDEHLIALEKTTEKYKKFEVKYNENPLPNLSLFHCDAVHFISHFCKESSIDGYYINYPNPYPKTKQRNKRFHHMPFFQHLIKTLKPNGKLFQSTNEWFYHRDSLDTFKNIPEFKSIEVIHVDKKTFPNFAPKTAFEAKYFERGEVLYKTEIMRK